MLDRPSNESAVDGYCAEQAGFHAELYVSKTVRLFHLPGQMIHVAIDAFPVSALRTNSCTITNVFDCADVKWIPTYGEFRYLVIAELPGLDIIAFGSGQPLLPGMTLTARICHAAAEPDTWSFEPIFAVQKTDEARA